MEPRGAQVADTVGDALVAVEWAHVGGTDRARHALEAAAGAASGLAQQYATGAKADISRRWSALAERMLRISGLLDDPTPEGLIAAKDALAAMERDLYELSAVSPELQPPVKKAPSTRARRRTGK